ncbi:hypothetical protein [Gelidibacter gilvus]|uniref:Signal transduction histidine kinase internal region domain-containing protein n=1 Tax=Gelidibacter gilvus TaxID=59602 RepID=A0A4Q0XJN9_9FLAO|nr:hypothetical protein [Gelidibacter gilvus]RXJ51501.1 hypothetical protein ESZ48_06455 [Gelidibacter gilvus]
MRNQHYDLDTPSDQFITILLVFICLFVILVFRNWYNLYKKRSFRKENERLIEQLKANQRDIENFNSQVRKTKSFEQRLKLSQAAITQLDNELRAYKEKFYSTLSQKEKEIEEQKDVINHQKIAYERYVNFKNVETNNTRLGAHFIKNVINQIYIDLITAENNPKSFLGVYYSFKRTENRVPSLKALKHIFKLLDYNVYALNKEHISLDEEWRHIEMFMELIQYLKPNANIKLETLISLEQKRHLKIKPTLFFPFVENALKHGSLNNENSFIRIVLKENEDKQLSYCLVNSAEQRLDGDNKVPPTSNFGLNALQQLLNAYYPNSKLEHRILPNNQYLSELTLNLN